MTENDLELLDFRVIDLASHIDPGVGAELSAQITEELFDELDSPVGRVAGLNVVSPFSPVLEDAEFPHPADIVSGVKKTLGR